MSLPLLQPDVVPPLEEAAEVTNSPTLEPKEIPLKSMEDVAGSEKDISPEENTENTPLNDSSPQAVEDRLWDVGVQEIMSQGLDEGWPCSP
ncbi:hypothetical protein Pmar_PMAR023769 [Perkinsus marinus ATCC 50983]|uniref:Uncharacterized protein n=1 Tax=Perkinsus marinus (strain ATCC 50983 / TXsc) TaxID=423536 RepID=C5KCH7_PERM5|nr:hypothetical protein Pmar_PMAR023769 [Perkinsus marinus ATCC 50983]EER17839.1 hypothetical protein Pmar_PMAR023769 [Perkinsus marinus ATCC 50983]|eukprot:XP_002786043.1 hypothetical protein Pmar_PMAR023769 [Perkinsus marinus ATCC 50983]